MYVMLKVEPLFSQNDAHAHLQQHRQQMQSEIATMNGDYLLNANVDDLAEYFAHRYALEVPELQSKEMRVDYRDAQRDMSGDPSQAAYVFDGPAIVTGTEILIEVPFTGDRQLFRIRPHAYGSEPHAELGSSTLTFTFWGHNMQADQARREIDEWLSNVNRHLQWLRESFGPFNERCAYEARQLIERRREKLLADKNLVNALKIPLKRQSPNVTYTAPEVKRKLTPKMPAATPGPYMPEPILEEAEYQHILGIISNMAHVMERSPSAFHHVDEEALRTIFLVSLNSHYEGQATGETFNSQGKTDILIRSGDRNIFIAECKFWGGAAKMTETIDQLLGYLSWRDSKSSILLFNRNRNFSKVLATVPGVVRAHPNFQKDEDAQGETRFRYAFRHKDDPAKIIHVTVMAFDMPQPSTTPISQ